MSRLLPRRRPLAHLALHALAFAPALTVALVVAAGASAHGGGTVSKLFLSEITSIAPAIPGVTGVVLSRDDQIELDNTQGAAFTVLGYEGEPYLRFGKDGVAVNLHSPARYLNSDRFAQVSLPADANAKLAPKWDAPTLGNRWSWHDHRIHWMSTILPPAAKADPKHGHLVFDWTIPVQVDGAGTSKISGKLTYVPPKSGSDIGLIVGIALPVGVVLLAGAATGLLVLRRRRGITPAA